LGLVFPPTDLNVIKRALAETLLTFLDKSLVVNPRLTYKILEGRAFSVSRRFEGVASDASVDIYFENPSGSGRTVNIVIVEVVSLAQAHVDIYRGNTVTAPGTPLTPLNLNLGSPTASVVNAEYGGAYTLGSLALNTVCPGGSRIRAVGGATEVGETVVAPEGGNFLVRATNKSASATDLSVRILWWED